MCIIYFFKDMKYTCMCNKVKVSTELALYVAKRGYLTAWKGIITGWQTPGVWPYSRFLAKLWVYFFQVDRVLWPYLQTCKWLTKVCCWNVTFSERPNITSVAHLYPLGKFIWMISCNHKASGQGIRFPGEGNWLIYLIANVLSLSPVEMET